MMQGRGQMGRAFGLIGGSQQTGASALLSGEPAGMALDFTGNAGLGYASVKGHTTDLTNVPADSFLTQSGTSPKLVLWSDSLYRWTPHNLVLQSETFGSWLLNDGAGGGAVTANATTAPDGTTTADKYVPNNGAVGSYIDAPADVTVVNGATYAVAIRAKAAGFNFIKLDGDAVGGRLAASAIFNLSAGTVSSVATGSASIAALGDGWYLCLIYGVTNSTGAKPWVRPYVDASTQATGDGTSGVYLWGAQLNRGTTPTSYHVTTSAAWYGVPIEWSASGYYALVEPAATNLALYASDFTNAAWTKSNLTTALTATGPDGVANSASTLTATAGNATALQAITSASASRVTSVFIKRRTGTGNIDVTQDNGSTWATQAVTSSWTRFSLAAVTAADPTVGIRIVTSGDAVDVWVFQHELSAVTSPVPTFAATVTRASDNINVAVSAMPYSNTAGTVLWEGKDLDGTLTLDIWKFAKDGNNLLRVEQNVANLACRLENLAAGSFDVTIGTVLLTTGVAAKLAAAWATNDFAFSKDGAAVATDVTGAVLTSPVTFSLSQCGRINKVIYLPRRMTNADLVTRSAA